MTKARPEAPMEEAVRHAAAAGKLRKLVRQHGETNGSAGLLRLADRHSDLAADALKKAIDW